MTEKELDEYIQWYVISTLTVAQLRNIGDDKLAEYVKKNYFPIPKRNLIKGKEYDGYCRNARKATWDGEKFNYEYLDCGALVSATINHYEDDNGYDVFIPIYKKEFLPKKIVDKYITT